MKRYLWISAGLIAGLFSSVQTARAYDVDTHFYAMYAMARYSGIGHETASLLALYTQWMDESPVTDPVPSNAFLGAIKAQEGAYKRRLLHFPSDRVADEFTAASMKFNGLNLFTETIPDHPFTGELFMEGAREGFLMKAAASLHVLVDSYAHAGTGALAGHAAFWHHPDRPFNDMELYKLMCRSVFRMVTAIRFLIPREALDKDLRSLPGGQFNYEADAQTLADSYLSLPEMMGAVSRNILTSVEYKRAAVQFFLNYGIRAKYLYPTVNVAYWMEQVRYDDDRYPEDLLTEIAQKLAVLDLQNIVAAKGTKKAPVLYINRVEALRVHGYDPTDKYFEIFIQNPEVRNKMIQTIVHQVMTGHIARRLTPFHKIDKEEDETEPMRKLEMDLRVGAIKKAIASLFGIKIHFVARDGVRLEPYSSFALESIYNRWKLSQQCKDLNDPGKRAHEFALAGADAVMVTVPCDHQLVWDDMMVDYLGIFPHLNTYVAFDSVMTEKRSPRMIPNGQNNYYWTQGAKLANGENGDILAIMKSKGEVKNLITKQQVQQWNTYYRAMNAMGMDLDKKAGSLYH